MDWFNGADVGVVPLRVIRRTYLKLFMYKNTLNLLLSEVLPLTHFPWKAMSNEVNLIITGVPTMMAMTAMTWSWCDDLRSFACPLALPFLRLLLGWLVASLSQIVQKCIKWCVKNSFPSDFNINFWHVVNHDKSIKNSSIFHILKGVGGKLAKFLRLKYRVNCIIMFLLVVHKESVKFFIWAGQKAMWIQNMF